ncbi:MAG: hypothetical protein ACOYNB_03125 [Aquabacterium sp.]|uniref:hypothetical protein n=1 Tax=Aquabacterium sp. TaxID=1872578 RepID=UPI003BBCF1D4
MMNRTRLIHLHRPLASPWVRGISLLVVLVVLALLSLGAASMMRQTIEGDLISQHIRMESLAHAAAEEALHHCEAAAMSSPARINPIPSSGSPAWQTMAHWLPSHPAYRAHTVTVTTPTVPAPQCMAEWTSTSPRPFMLITARGFSPDYVASRTGLTERGTVVWLQTVWHVPAPRIPDEPTSTGGAAPPTDAPTSTVAIEAPSAASAVRIRESVTLPAEGEPADVPDTAPAAPPQRLAWRVLINPPRP